MALMETSGADNRSVHFSNVHNQSLAIEVAFKNTSWLMLQPYGDDKQDWISRMTAISLRSYLRAWPPTSGSDRSFGGAGLAGRPWSYCHQMPEDTHSIMYQLLLLFSLKENIPSSFSILVTPQKPEVYPKV